MQAERTENIKSRDFNDHVISLLKALFENRTPPPMKIDVIPASSVLKSLIYYYCRESLSAEAAAELQITHQQFIIAEMRRTAALKKIGSILTEAGISFYPVKGSLLAYDYYPDPSLRYSVDLDLLLAEEESRRAFELIAANGWKPAHGFSEFEGKHLPELINRRLCTVELHIHLFGRLPGENRELNDILHDDPSSPELHLAYLMYHAFHQHNWANAVKTIIDVGMILRRNTVDPQKYRRLAEKFQVDDLLESVLASFPEFYPEQWRAMLPARRLTPGVKEAIRAIAMRSGELLGGCTESELAFIADSAAKSSSAIVWERLCSLSPTVLGITYDVSRSKAYLLYPLLLLHYLCTRLFTFISLRRKNHSSNSAELRRIYKNLAELKKRP